MSHITGTAEENQKYNTILPAKKLLDSNLSGKMMVCNVWSMLNEQKLYNILQVFDDQNIDIACICATWFNSKEGTFTSKIKETGYEIIHANRENKRGGGVAIIYKKQLTIKQGEASASMFSSLEYSYCVLQSGRSKILLACIYRKQEVNCSIYCEELEKLIKTMFYKGDKVIIVGDFNVWVDVQDNTDTKRLLTLMNAYGFTQLIHEPTHVGGHTLDHVYANESEIKLNYKVEERFDISTDHYPIVIDIPTIEIKHLEDTITVRDTKNMDIQLLKTDFKCELDSINGDLANGNFESSYKQYYNVAKQCVDKHAPILTKTRRHKKVQWMDAEYRMERTKRRRLEKRWRKSKSESDRKNYVDQRQHCADLSIAKQSSYYSKVVEEIGNDQKLLFKMVNNLLDKDKVRVLPEHTDPLQLANEFNQYYIEKVDKIRRSIPSTTQTIENINLVTGEKMKQFEPVTEKELKQIIQEYGVKTSTEDPIPMHILKNLIDEALPTLTKLINKSLAEGSMDGVKSSVLDPLLKKAGLDSEIRKNFRPVNNLVFFSKLIERVVKIQLDQHMAVNALHIDSFFGYKTHHNTETMMVGLVDEALMGFDNDQCTIIIFLDLSAAFDTIDIDKMISILEDEIGITDIALQWFRSFLSGRTQRVKIGTTYSSVLEVIFGAPQGSVLGPKLFNIYIRSQPGVFRKCRFVTSSFADDLNGRRTFSLTFQYNTLKNDIAKCMDEITHWMNGQHLKINPDKTEILLLYPKNLKERIKIKGTFINEQCIRFSNDVKNVGVWLDENLSFDKHINKIVAYSYKLLKDIGRIRNIISRKHTETLVHSVISSRLDNSNSLFFNMKKSNIYKLQKVQNAAARLITKKRRRESATTILKELHWLKIESRIMFKILLLVYKRVNGRSPNNLNINYKMHNCRPDDYLLLATKKVNTVYGRRTFEYAGPKLWNALPLDVRTEENIDVFKKRVKTILFADSDGFCKKAFCYNN